MLVWIGALIQWVRGGGTMEAAWESPRGKSMWKESAAYFYTAVEALDFESRRKILYLFVTCLLPLYIHSSTATIVITSSQLCTFFYHVVRLKCFFVRWRTAFKLPFFFSLLLLICVFHIVSPTDLRCCWCLCLLQDENDNPPEFSKLSYIVKIPENVIAGESL